MRTDKRYIIMDITRKEGIFWVGMHGEMTYWSTQAMKFWERTEAVEYALKMRDTIGWFRIVELFTIRQ